MSSVDETSLSYRLMNHQDINEVPLMCQGTRDAVSARIDDIGSAAVLVFDGDQHVAQLQFRRYDAALRSPDGLWDPLYWGDFGDYAPRLSQNSLAVFCFHVGQLENSGARDQRYQGRGIGLEMLDHLLTWAETQNFAAITAKFTPAPRPVMSFMGGQPLDAYVERGFELHRDWIDEQLWEVVQQRGLVEADTTADEAARVGCCIRRF